MARGRYDGHQIPLPQRAQTERQVVSRRQTGRLSRLRDDVSHSRRAGRERHPGGPFALEREQWRFSRIRARTGPCGCSGWRGGHDRSSCSQSDCTRPHRCSGPDGHSLAGKSCDDADERRCTRSDASGLSCCSSSRPADATACACGHAGHWHAGDGRSYCRSPGSDLVRPAAERRTVWPGPRRHHAEVDRRRTRERRLARLARRMDRLAKRRAAISQPRSNWRSRRSRDDPFRDRSPAASQYVALSGS